MRLKPCPGPIVPIWGLPQTKEWPLEALATVVSLFPFGDLFLEIVNILLGAFLSEQFARLIRDIGFQTQGLELVSLSLRHYWFLWHHSTPAC